MWNGFTINKKGLVIIILVLWVINQLKFFKYFLQVILPSYF